VRDGKLFTGEPCICDFQISLLAPDRFGESGVTLQFICDGSNAMTGFKAGEGRMRDVGFARVR
jgi:hypothetical protein